MSKERRTDDQRLYGALRQLRRLAETAVALQKRVSSAEESLDSMVRDISRLVNEIDDLLGSDQKNEEVSGPARRRTATSRQRRSHDSASVWAARVDIMLKGRGESEAAVDGGKTMRLSKTLSAYLIILASDEAPVNGAVVGWKPKRDVTERMEKQFGRMFAPHTLDNLSNRLRMNLEHIGEPRTLLQSDRRLGVRFAVQRGGLTVSERLEP